MSKPLRETVGFSHPVEGERARKRHDRAFAELITTAALMVCLAVAITAVSIGISRAQNFGDKTQMCCVR